MAALGRGGHSSFFATESTEHTEKNFSLTPFRGFRGLKIYADRGLFHADGLSRRRTRNFSDRKIRMAVMIRVNGIGLKLLPKEASRR